MACSAYIQWFSAVIGLPQQKYDDTDEPQKMMMLICLEHQEKTIDFAEALNFTPVPSSGQIPTVQSEGY